MVLKKHISTDDALYVENFAGRAPDSLLDYVQELSKSNSLRFDAASINHLTASLSKRWGDFFSSASYYSSLLNSGFDAVQVKNFLPITLPKVVCQAMFLAFVSRMGRLSPHGAAKDSLIWTMKPQSEKSGNRFRTFSEHSAAAPLHTDSQYRPKPENFLAFYVYRQARCGGGQTTILNGRKLLNSVVASAWGRSVVKTLSLAKIPFLIPPIFITDPRKTFVRAPIFGKNPLLRYRSDTLQTELIKAPPLQKQGIIESLEFLREAIDSSVHTCEFLLSDGDLLLINNYTNLHGRRAFADQNRCLFRIRFD
ncbi:MAG TPA: TauD/TfdA family dioxygenase [Pyrinomonadaceae bacterium]|jgi:alpha-ketoglutarate-dependent taurine dioxygenase